MSEEPAKKSNRHLLSELVRDKTALAAACFLALVIVVAIFAPLVAPHDPNEQDIIQRLLPPVWVERGTADHILGTDQLGRDNLSRIIFASRVSLTVGLSVVAITLVIGTALGILSGYLGGRVDHLIMGVTDIIMSFPGLLMVLSIAALIGAGITSIIIALSVRFWTTYARITRGAVLSLREMEFMTAAKVIGGDQKHVIRVHLIPNLLSPLATLVPLELGRVMLSEASVSFLGLGVRPPMTSWGMLVAEGRDYVSSAWWLITFAGLALFLTVLSANMLGSWLRLASDPIHRGKFS
jgi:peptide/nickel transport system permease protein